MMVAILQKKASKLIIYFVSFTVVIFTILNDHGIGKLIKVYVKLTYNIYNFYEVYSSNTC